MSEGDSKSTGQTPVIPANTPLIPERQIINHARVVAGFSNPHENSAGASAHKVMLSKSRKKKTNRRARRAGYPLAYTKESEARPQNVNVRKKLREVCQS
jgi:hypothetical protein